MGREAQASLRLSAELKRECQKIAKETHRTLSNTMELLLWRGVEDFKSTGILGDARPRKLRGKSKVRGLSDVEDAESTRFAEDLARQIMQHVMERADAKVKLKSEAA